MADKLSCFGMRFKVSRELPPAQKLYFGDDGDIEAIAEYGVNSFVIC